MASAELPHVVRVTAEDRAAIENFSCDRGTPWSQAIEVMVRNDLADALQSGFLDAVGIWDGEDLAAVVVYQPLRLMPSNWRVRAIGTRASNAGRGYATALIETVQARAQAGGASCLSGLIHHENTKMIRIMGSLGAVIFERPDDENVGFVLAI